MRASVTAATPVSAATAAFRFTPASFARVLANAYPHATGVQWMCVRLRPFVCPFERLLELMPERGSFLDIGCGVGIVGVLLAHSRRARRIVGIDVSRRAIAVADRALLPDTTERVFKTVNAADTWPQERFDAVLCIDVLHHVPSAEQRAFVGRMARLDFADAIYFKDVSPRPRWKWWANRLHDLFVSGDRVRARDEGEVKRWFEEEGLEVAGPRRLDLLWYSHYLLIVRRRSSRTPPNPLRRFDTSHPK